MISALKSIKTNKRMTSDRRRARRGCGVEDRVVLEEEQQQQQQKAEDDDDVPVTVDDADDEVQVDDLA